MKKIILSLVLILSVLTLFACGSKNASSSANADGSKKLVMVTNAEFPPYEYEEGGKIVGIDVEIAEAIAKKLGCEFEILNVDFDSVITALTQGKADFALAALTVTEDRKEFVDFSDTYQNAVQNIIVKENSAIKSVDDLADAKIGVQLGTTGDIYCSGDFGDENVERFKSPVDAVVGVTTGQLDCVVVDDQVAKELVKNTAGLKILDTSYADEEYAIAVKKNSPLLNDINGAIKSLKNDGTIKSIIDKYIK